jgi:hypothetical protein
MKHEWLPKSSLSISQGECPMKQKTLKNRITGMISAAAIALCIALGAAPSSAADRVVVIPMGKSGAPAPVAKTGQSMIYATGDDGDLEKGVGIADGRFVDNNNGTVTDNQTGLIWLKEGQCTTFFLGDNTNHNYRPWSEAIVAANKLAVGYCGLSDGSKAGDWRLPNVNELLSLIDRGHFNPALPTGCPLAASTIASVYWSSTTYAEYVNYYYAGAVYFYSGDVSTFEKSFYHSVRCVRGGQ